MLIPAQWQFGPVLVRALPYRSGQRGQPQVHDTLAHWLQRAPEQPLPLARDAHGRPRLLEPYADRDAGWSHSGDQLLLAMGQDVVLGVDLERLRPRPRVLELSRRFRALKLWVMFKLRGVDAYRQAIAANIALRESLDARIEAEPELERLASGLSISCFRYHPVGVDPEALDRINAAIQARLVATGEIALSPTTLDGRYSLRVCIVNFRTRAEDIDWLVERVLAFGRDAVASIATP